MSLGAYTGTNATLHVKDCNGIIAYIHYHTYICHTRSLVHSQQTLLAVDQEVIKQKEHPLLGVSCGYLDEGPLLDELVASVHHVGALPLLYRSLPVCHMLQVLHPPLGLVDDGACVSHHCQTLLRGFAVWVPGWSVLLQLLQGGGGGLVSGGGGSFSEDVLDAELVNHRMWGLLR